MAALGATLMTLHVGSALVLLGGLSTFTIRERRSRRADFPVQRELDRVFRRFGLVLSVSLAVLIFSGIGQHYLDRGDFRWGFTSPQDTVRTVKALMFLGFWVHWGWVEVVTFDGIRRMMNAAAPSPEVMDGHRRAWRATRLLLAELALIFGVSVAALQA